MSSYQYCYYQPQSFSPGLGLRTILGRAIRSLGPYRWLVGSLARSVGPVAPTRIWGMGVDTAWCEVAA